MSFTLDLNKLTEKQRETIAKTLSVKSNKTLFNPTPQSVYAFATNSREKKVYLPLFQYPKYIDTFPHSVDKYPKINLKFKYELYTKETDPSGRGRDQDIVAKKAIEILKDTHTVFISAFTGYGKTASATYLFCKLGLKTIIISHDNVLKIQWRDEIKKFTGNAKIQIIEGNKPLNPDADVYIIGIRKASMMTRDVLANIGTVVVDEAHICTRTCFTNSLLKFRPMYLIGLSATPDRVDGLDKLLDMYFGPKKNFIVRHEVKNFTVIKYRTKYKPEVNYRQFRGRLTLAWTEMMSSLANIKERTIEIGNLALKHPKEKIMILCGRQNMAKYLFKYLIDSGDSVELLIGSKKTWDKTKRILVAGVKKGGVGLNDEYLTMLIVASDMKNVRQCEGRIRTTDNLVYDIVDNYPTLENHWKLREKWYFKRGATIQEQGVKHEHTKEKQEMRKRFLKPNRKMRS